VSRRTAIALGTAIAVVASAWTCAAPAGGRPAVRVSISAAGHAPAAGRPWRFAVRAVTQGGRAVGGTAIVRVLVGDRVVDTVGWFGFNGTLHHSYRWPVALAGAPATLQVTVPIGRTAYAGSYKVRIADTTGKPQFATTLSGGGRAPAPGRPWPYVLQILDGNGRSADATAIIRVISGSQVLDTVGWFEVRGRLEGVYRWPRQFQGQPDGLQATVVGPGGTRTVTYRLRVRR
jgi:hypothetical protein